MFAAVYAAEGSPSDVLMEVARDFSPRVEACGGREVTLDLSGLTRLFGDAKTIAAELRRTAADRGLQVRVTIAGTRTAARLLVHDRAGVTIVEPGDEAAALDSLPLALLARITANDQNANDPNDQNVSNAPNGSNAPNDPNGSNDPNDMLVTLRRWGLRTLGDLAALPPDDVAARLGQAGVDWQRLARGEDPRPLVPAVPDERFEQALDLEWPIEGLEPLSFVLGRLMEPLSAHLERRDRGAAVLHVRLHLVTREVHERSLQLPAPIRDARTLRTLALLDLESHPPPAAIDRVVVAVDPTPGRVVQFSLLTRPLPSPEQLSTLMARLHALMGEGRCGAAVAIDSWEPGAFTMERFAPDTGIRESPIPNPQSPSVALRRFRFPVPVRVRVDCGVPVRVIVDRRGWSGGHVETHAGPWRTSGGWWVDGHVRTSSHPQMTRGWERDEWDVTLSDGATYRIFRERDTDAWFIEGVVD
jgi:protein ImuB